jgi:CHAT domain-containing protein/Tfp pilus assembly protein PilF
MFWKWCRSSLAFLVLLALSLSATAQDLSPEELSSRLLAAKSHAERNAILDQQKTHLTPEIVQAIRKVGSSQRTGGQLDQALKTFQVAEELAEQAGDRRGISDAWFDIAVIHDIQGDHRKALEYFQKSLNIAEMLDDKKMLAQRLSAVGVAFLGLNEYSQALAKYQEAVAIAESIHDEARVAKVWINIGNLYRDLGNNESALEFFQKARIHFETKSLDGAPGNDRADLSTIFLNLGAVYMSQGNYSLALEYFQKSLVALGPSGEKSVLGSILNDIGQVYYLQGDYAQALNYFRRELALGQTMGADPLVAGSLENLALVEQAQGHYTTALAHFQKSLAMIEKQGTREDSASLLMNIGGVQEQLGHLDQAMASHKEALTLAEALGDPTDISSANVEIAKLYERKHDFTDALTYAQRAVEISAQERLQGTLWQAQDTAGLAYQGLGQVEQARQSFEDAISTVELLRMEVAGGEEERQSFLAKRISPYQDMVQLLVAQNNAADAFAYAERAKGRSLLEVLDSARVDITKSMTFEERQKERQLRLDMVSLNRQIEQESAKEKPAATHLGYLKVQLESTRLQYRDLQTNLYAVHPELRIQRGNAKVLSLQETAMLLPDSGNALLEFVSVEEKTFLFVLTRSQGTQQVEPQLNIYTIPVTAKQLKWRAEHFSEQLGHRDLAFMLTSRELFRTLIGPAKAQLLGKNALVVVPDGPLWNLPFQALLGSDGHYLLEDFAISYAPSLTVLREMMRVHKSNLLGTAKPESPALLAMADPTLARETMQRAAIVYRGELSALPEAKREVLNLKQLYGMDQSKVYVGVDAGEDRFKAEAGQFRVLHLATHGVFDDANPMYSYVLLSVGDKNSKEDGLLEAWEISQMDLKADLAVLSACESARGRVSAGEGVIGLTWAFFVAGVPTTVVSQWKVESSSTADLMVAFHQSLKKLSVEPGTRFTVSRSMQQAALQLLHNPQYSHPFYWAGFVVVGDPN